MVDRGKVVKGLEKCSRYECADCTEIGASHSPWDCPTYDNFVENAITLLKEQEPLPVLEGKVNECTCGHEINRYWHPKLCGFCGKELIWY